MMMMVPAYYTVVAWQRFSLYLMLFMVFLCSHNFLLNEYMNINTLINHFNFSSSPWQTHEKLAWNRTRSIWCEKLAWEISCCNSEWHTYKFLAPFNSQEFLVQVSHASVMGFMLVFTDHVDYVWCCIYCTNPAARFLINFLCGLLMTIHCRTIDLPVDHTPFNLPVLDCVTCVMISEFY